MLGIVACHFGVHGGFDFPENSFTLNRLWQQFIRTGGSLGNDIFVLLSGYFLVNSQCLNLRKMLNLWVRMLFYSVVIYCLFACTGMQDFSLKALLRVARPVTRPQWWFASAYFVLYLIHPYLNTLIKAMSREDCTKFVKALAVYWCILPMLTKYDFGANSTINFICLYCFAGYVRLWGENFSGTKYLWFGVACIALNFASIVVIEAFTQRNPMYFIGMMRPFTLGAALCLLVGFRNLEIPHSKFINMIASATFGVYLIHDHNLVRPFLWRTVFRNASFQNSTYLIPYSIAVVPTVYIVCTLIELARAKLFRTLSSGRLS